DAPLPAAVPHPDGHPAGKRGADMGKTCPAPRGGGPKFLKALRGPLPHVKLLPTGGVNADTAGEYIAAGAAALGVGSELIDPAALARGDDALLTARARELCEAVAAARAKH